ncbi:MAG: xanthine phosphoribosyltransferase [Clostridiales bacterium]|nr:xanthine phosphoribosyltransferase [Candidatus Scatonaster coprocaballi]
MKELEAKILREGEVFPGGILKVGSFLNQQIDVPFMMEMGQEAKRLFAGEPITKILTVESSGIAVGFAVAAAMGLPMVFAKKHKSLNLSDNLLRSSVFSFTHQTTYDIVVSNDYLTSSDVVLIVDDFLAKGNAIVGLLELCEQAGAKVAGAVVAVEKGFQGGGDLIREKGIRVEALARIESMSDDSVTFSN